MLQVLCGIVGTKRFKFDVWSNDVTLANEMESTGRPGQVHVSEATYRFLPEEVYVTTEGPEHKGTVRSTAPLRVLSTKVGKVNSCRDVMPKHLTSNLVIYNDVYPAPVCHLDDAYYN